jgi:hypothetical protein
MIEQSELGLTLEDHQKAFTEVSFLLNIFAVTIEELMGGGAPTVGRLAGQHIARRLPIYQPHPTPESVVLAVAEQMSSGFEMSCKFDAEGADLNFERCAVRSVCQERQQEIGGGICRLLHFAIGGMVNELLGRPVRARIIEAGKKVCKTRLDFGGV